MRSALAAVALMVAANGVVLVSASRERSAPATLTTIDVCAAHLVGGAGSDNPPALRLTLLRDTSVTPWGLDSAGLRALGFDQADVAKVGEPGRDSAHWTRERPAWVRLGQLDDSLRQFHAIEVAPSRDQLVPDSTSLIVRGLVAIRRLRIGPPHQHADGSSAEDILYPVVDEVIPSMLHLDRDQIAALRTALPDSAGCAMARKVGIAQGSNGGLWVHDIR